MLAHPLFQPLTIQLAAGGGNGMGGVIQVSSRQFAVPFAVDLETQAIRKGIGENPCLRASEAGLT